MNASDIDIAVGIDGHLLRDIPYSGPELACPIDRLCSSRFGHTQPHSSHDERDPAPLDV